MGGGEQGKYDLNALQRCVYTFPVTYNEKTEGLKNSSLIVFNWTGLST